MKASVSELDKIVDDLLSRPVTTFDLSLKSNVPTTAGLYAIRHKITGEYLHAGISNKSLRQRIFGNHLKGGGKGAGSDLIQKVQDRGCAEGREVAEAWIRANCSFQWIEIEDSELRHWAEHRLLSHLRPIWCMRRKKPKLKN